MLYFLHGDSQKIFEKATALTEAMLSKKPDAAVFKIDLDNWSINKMTEMLGGQSLFTQKYIVLVSKVVEDRNVFEEVTSLIKEMQNSGNVFIWFEKEIDKKTLNKIEKVAEKVQSYDSKKVSKKTGMNIFDLANAIGERDKKKAWLLYQEALQEFSAEEIYGTMWWQIKTMLLVSKTNSATEAGVKDFPYSRSKKFCHKYPGDDLEDLATDLIDIYHGSRLKSESLELNLEKFILSI